MKTCKSVSLHLQTIANLLRVLEEAPFRARAFTKASSTLMAYEEEFDSLCLSQNWAALPGIGSSISQEIQSFLENKDSEKTPLQEELANQIPDGLQEKLDDSTAKTIAQLRPLLPAIKAGLDPMDCFLSSAFLRELQLKPAQTDSLIRLLELKIETLPPEEPLKGPKIRGLFFEGSVPPPETINAFEFLFSDTELQATYPEQMIGQWELPLYRDYLSPVPSWFWAPHRQKTVSGNPRLILLPLDPLWHSRIPEFLNHFPEAKVLMICRDSRNLGAWLYHCQKFEKDQSRILNFFSREAVNRFLHSLAQEAF